MSNIELPEGYIPNESEEFMNPKQLEYFKRKLLKWRQHIFREYGDLINSLKEEPLTTVDDTDRACEEFEVGFDIKNKDRALKLVKKIDHALQKINNGTFGYCEISGEPISLKRLIARPIATLGIKEQEKHEKYEREHCK